MFRSSLFLTATLLAWAVHAAEPSKCNASEIPVQITEVAKPAPWPEKAHDSWVRARNEQLFQALITKITEHISAWQAKEKLCLNNVDGGKPSSLTFQRWPDIAAEGEPFALPPPFDERPSGGCRITSPWVDIVVERKLTIRVHGVVHWNPRQMIVDQATLDGVRNLPPTAIPLKAGEFDLQIRNYGYRLKSYSGPRDSSSGWAKRFDVPVPADLLWLFENSGRIESTSRLASQIRGGGQSVTERTADRFIDLVTTLIDQCLAHEGLESNYQSILDAKDLISLKKYRMPRSPLANY